MVYGTGGFMNPDKVVDAFGVSQGMKVADFGCGAGYFTISLAQRVGSSGRVYGLDVVESALDSLSAKTRVNGLNNIETIRANLEILGGSGLANESQDIVLLANILFQSNKKESILDEGKRVLKSGGKLIIIDWKKGALGGPPDDLRLDPIGTEEIAKNKGFVYEHPIDAGQFHFGFIFSKP
ncbi:MAG: methyltransferase domain-containing protein [Candidatus Taylorbacteria bacterium]|nr:methyltransferase domain-containing protein [Candidatus Taylorbacteria bacterium]